ncbi:hypothetical protein OPQ81_000336 [Rhizoctonia solani]|nr:hypothetical protein OPQ81_000336 [Rhizoctonia solani]
MIAQRHAETPQRGILSELPVPPGFAVQLPVNPHPPLAHSHTPATRHLSTSVIQSHPQPHSNVDNPIPPNFNRPPPVAPSIRQLHPDPSLLLNSSFSRSKGLMLIPTSTNSCPPATSLLAGLPPSLIPPTSPPPSPSPVTRTLTKEFLPPSKWLRFWGRFYERWTRPRPKALSNVWGATRGFIGKVICRTICINMVPPDATDANPAVRVLLIVTI